jgi:hypothetical protein
MFQRSVETIRESMFCKHLFLEKGIKKREIFHGRRFRAVKAEDLP